MITSRTRCILSILLAALIALTAITALSGCAKQETNTNKHEASLAREDVEKYNGPQFVIRYTSDAYGFVEEFTLYDSHGKIYVYTNDTGHAQIEDESDLVPGYLEKIREKGTEVSGSKKYKTEETINNAWLEAIMADYNAEKTKPEKDEDAYSNKDYYVFDTDGKAHWIMCEGKENYQLKDEHVSAAKGAFIGD